jgi:hypothetical protein
MRANITIVIAQKLSFWIHYEWSFQNNIHIETSSAFDINIVENLLANGKINKSTYVICNGFKRDQYIENIARLINKKTPSQLLITLKNLICCKVKSRINSKLELYRRWRRAKVWILYSRLIL